jgi:hypothetical protein
MTFSRGRDGQEGRRSCAPSPSSFSFFRDRVRSAGMFRGVQAKEREADAKEGMIRYVLFRGVRKSHAQEAHRQG